MDNLKIRVRSKEELISREKGLIDEATCEGIMGEV